jgi:hypothetical protein
MHLSPDQRLNQRPNQQRPIGYWLKHLDQLIDDTFDQTLGARQLTRRHWQVLNLLARQPADHAELRAALAPFLLADPDPDAETMVSADLIRRGWLADDDGLLRLTDTGLQAHEDLLTTVTATRRRTVAGITDAEYLATVDVLQRMAANLSRSPQPEGR